MNGDLGGVNVFERVGLLVGLVVNVRDVGLRRMTEI